MVDQKPQLLPYARPMPAPPRPAMYRLVVTILLAGGVIILAIAASGAFFTIIFGRHGWGFAVAPFVVAALFFYTGIRSLTVAVQYLRGKTPSGDDPERWLFAA